MAMSAVSENGGMVPSGSRGHMSGYASSDRVFPAPLTSADASLFGRGRVGSTGIVCAAAIRQGAFHILSIAGCGRRRPSKPTLHRPAGIRPAASSRHGSMQTVSTKSGQRLCPGPVKEVDLPVCPRHPQHIENWSAWANWRALSRHLREQGWLEAVLLRASPR
jgi:hypothetical protein